MLTKRQSGMTLAELLVAMVVIAVGLAGVLTAFSVVVKNSSDPLIRKQMLAIAEEMMEEITPKQFAVTGSPPSNSEKDCRSGAAAVAPREDFDDVSDYAGYATLGICDIEGLPVVALAAYAVSVTVTTGAALDGITVGTGDVKKVSVLVSHGNETLELNGWRVNYAAP
jgi:MSHA pilin protein MshD